MARHGLDTQERLWRALREDAEGRDPCCALDLQLVARNQLELVEVLDYRGLQTRCRRDGITMGTAEGLLDHLVEETELVETVGGEIQRIRRGLLLVLALPQDR